MQHFVQLESCTMCPPLKLLCATLLAIVAEVELAPTSAISRATVSPCVHYLQHCMQLCDAILRAVMHHVSVP